MFSNLYFAVRVYKYAESSRAQGWYILQCYSLGTAAAYWLISFTAVMVKSNIQYLSDFLFIVSIGFYFLTIFWKNIMFTLWKMMVGKFTS